MWRTDQKRGWIRVKGRSEGTGRRGGGVGRGRGRVCQIMKWRWEGLKDSRGYTRLIEEGGKACTRVKIRYKDRREKVEQENDEMNRKKKKGGER